MYAISVSLFGKFCVQCNGNTLDGFEASKVQELFCYLLLNRDRSHHRETLANLLWEDISTVQSKRYLSKALWQLQAALNAQVQLKNGRLLLVEADWIQLISNSDLWLDVDFFEKAFIGVREKPGYQLNNLELQSLLETVELYEGDLLEGWYQPWCLYERERLRYKYLVMLDKLMDYFEADGKYQTSLIYGMRLLRRAPARERTHRRIMRLLYLYGDRTEALYQYERCVAILDKELGVGPAEQTKTLYKQIKAEQLKNTSTMNISTVPSRKNSYSRQKILQCLERMLDLLTDTQDQIQQEIESLKMIF